MGCRGRKFAVKGLTAQWGKGTFGAACFKPLYRQVLLQWDGAGGSAGDLPQPLGLREVPEEARGFGERGLQAQ